MKKIAFLIGSMIILNLLAAGCNIGTTVDTVATSVAGTLTAMPQPATPAPVVPSATVEAPVGTITVTIPAVEGKTTSCSRLTFTLSPKIASDITCQTIAEANEEGAPYFGINPEYTYVTLTGYVLPDTFHKPQIFVYPVQRYSELAPDAIPDRVTSLQSLIQGNPPVGGLPFLPFFNAAQEFYAQYQKINFANGSGIRFITQYSQAALPINNHELFYTFQGLTSDNAYWVSVILPVSNPILPADNTPPAGVDPNTWMNQFESYIADLTPQLNAQSTDSFAPTLTLLDALVSSITITP